MIGRIGRFKPGRASSSHRHSDTQDDTSREGDKIP